MAHLVLDPAHHPLWRDESTLQLGMEGRVRIVDPERWQQRLIDRLVAGVDDDLDTLSASLGVEVAALRAFLDLVAPALRRERAPRPLHVATADGVEPRTVTIVCDALTACGWAPEWVTASTATRGVPVVLIAHHLVPPTIWPPLLRDDVVHLPVVFAAERAQIGPVVVPGENACLACLAAHERDRDHAWSVLALQLLARTPPPVAAPLGVAAGTLAAELLAARGRSAASSRSAIVSGDGRRHWRTHRPHAECLCRSPRDTATAPANLSRMPSREATRARATALRA